MKTIFVLVDALKSTYLTQANMPFLYNLALRGFYIKKIIPCAGFCERSEIFSGLDGYDTGNFTAIGFMPQESQYKNDSFLLHLFEAFNFLPERIRYKLFSKWRIRVGRRMNSYRIPYLSLKNFALTEDGGKKIIQHDTIFDELQKKGLTYTMEAFTSLSDLSSRLNGKSIISFAKESVNQGIDFIPLYIGTIDSIGHQYGSDIEKINPYLRDVDKQLEELYYLAMSNKYSFCVLGDHGMVPVSEKIDVMKIVSSTNLQIRKDYEVFYDSTTVRFWFFNKNAEEKIREILKDKLCDKGMIVDKNNFTTFRIPLDLLNDDNLPIYGHIVWCAKPGILISPDYFHSKNASENGMHGYLEIVKGEGTGLFVAIGENIENIKKDEGLSSSICRELCKILNINTPNSLGWNRQVVITR